MGDGMGERKREAITEMLVDRLIPLAIEDRRIRALWLEADTRAELRRPYGRVTLHAAAEEPDFASLTNGWEEILGGLGRLRSGRWSDTPRNARLFEAEIEIEAVSGPVRCIIECAALLAKRPRKTVASLVDKTGHLLHVLDFSKRG